MTTRRCRCWRRARPTPRGPVESAVRGNRAGQEIMAVRRLRPRRRAHRGDVHPHRDHQAQRHRPTGPGSPMCLSASPSYHTRGCTSCCSGTGMPSGTKPRPHRPAPHPTSSNPPAPPERASRPAVLTGGIRPTEADGNRSNFRGRAVSAGAIAGGAGRGEQLRQDDGAAGARAVGGEAQTLVREARDGLTLLRLEPRR